MRWARRWDYDIVALDSLVAAGRLKLGALAFGGMMRHEAASGDCQKGVSN